MGPNVGIPLPTLANIHIIYIMFVLLEVEKQLPTNILFCLFLLENYTTPEFHVSLIDFISY